MRIIKIKKGYLMLFITLFLLSISCMLITTNIYAKEQNEKISRGFYTEKAYSAIVSGLSADDSFVNWLHGDIYQGCTVYRTGLSEETDCRGVGFGGQTDSPPLLSGRYFTAEESTSEERLAVIGSSIAEQTTDRDGDVWLEIGGEEFRVIGTIGKRSQTRLDSMIFIPLGTAAAVYGADGEYIIDGQDSQKISDVCRSFSVAWQKDADISIDESAGTQAKSVKNILDSGTNKTLFTVYFAIFFSFVLTAASCTIYWMDYRRQRVTTMRILGCPNSAILRTLTTCYLKVSAPAVLAGMCVTASLYARNVIDELRGIDFLLSFLVTALTGYIFLILIMPVLSRRSGKTSLPDLLLRNGILGVQFAIFFWVFVQIIGYYIDLNSNPWIQTCKGNYSYLTLALNGAESSFNRMRQAEDDPLYHVHAQRALKDLRNTPDFTYMAYTEDFIIRLAVDTAEDIWGKEGYEDFLWGTRHPAIPKPEPEELDGTEQIRMAFYSIDYNAMTHYNLTVQKGRLFEPDDFEAAQDEKDFPVLLGAAYSPFFSVGDTFPFYTGYGAACSATVVGILDENMMIISEMTKEDEGYPTLLDHDIILPLLSFESLPRDEYLKHFAIENDSRQLLGTIVLQGEAGSIQKVEVQKTLNDIYRKENLFTIVTMDAPDGIYLFQGETRQSMAVLTVLLAIVLGFSMFSLCVSLVNRINRNMYRYSIQIMNGCGIRRIFLGYFFEVGCVVTAGFGIAVYLQRNTVLYNPKYLAVMAIILFCLVLLSGGIILRKLCTVDIETLMRKKE